MQRWLSEDVEPEQLDEWIASDELDWTVRGEQRMVETIANAGTLAAGVADIEPWKLIPGARPPQVVQSLEDQIAAAEAIAAIQSGGNREQ